MTNLLRQPNKQKASDFAVWLNFTHRVEGKCFGVIKSSEGAYLIVSINDPAFKNEEFEVLPDAYSNMEYTHIQSIGIDVEPLHHFEEIKGMISVMDGEILRFILKYHVPLEKFIRYELASRGYDEDHQWVGFEKAEAIWLQE